MSHRHTTPRYHTHYVIVHRHEPTPGIEATPCPSERLNYISRTDSRIIASRYCAMIELGRGECRYATRAQHGTWELQYSYNISTIIVTSNTIISITNITTIIIHIIINSPRARGWSGGEVPPLRFRGAGASAGARP